MTVMINAQQTYIVCVDQNTYIQLSLELFISNIIYINYPIVRYFLTVVEILWQVSNEEGWSSLWFLVRSLNWTCLCMFTIYDQIDCLTCSLARWFQGYIENRSRTQLNKIIERNASEKFSFWLLSAWISSSR